VAIRGRVLDPDGNPVKDAKLLFLYGSGKKYPDKVWATSADDGRFRFAVPVDLVDNGYAESPWEHVYVLAAAPGYGFAVEWAGGKNADVTLRLVKDDVPIQGRLLDLQGKPVAGVRVRVSLLFTPQPRSEDLTAWLTALKANKFNPQAVDAANLRIYYSPSFDLLFPPVTTGSDGRFRLAGIGRERLARLRIDGPTIASQEVDAMTRASEAIKLLKQKDEPRRGTVTYYGASFDLPAAPTRPVEGIVRDKDTGKPLAGITVESARIAGEFRSGFLRTTTDRDGRYRLLGLPKGADVEIAAKTDVFPYLTAVETVENRPGLGPVTVDIALKLGVWVKGRVTDKTTGKPLWASVEYFCFADNPNAKELSRVGNVYHWRSTLDDGVFRMPVVPGRGLLAIRAYHDHYRMGVGAERIKGGRTQDLNFFVTTPYLCSAQNYHAVVEIVPKGDEESIPCEVALERGGSLRGTVLGPDGKPLTGARIVGLKELSDWTESGAAFTVEGLSSDRPRLLQVMHPGRKLAGYLILEGGEKDPPAVRLQAWGTLTGRLVTPQGEPLRGVSVHCNATVKRGEKVLQSSAHNVPVDRDGRFRIEGLAAGLSYEFFVTKSPYALEIVRGKPGDLTLKAGQTKELGEVVVKPME
jgi:hypothetical protein